MKFNEKNYWNNRYSTNGNSGAGSYGSSALNKANYINNVINKYNVKSICELGCGDGNQLSMFEGYDIYHGYDISDVIIDKNIKKFSDDNTKSFYKSIEDFPQKKYDLSLSLDVLYHLVNLEVYEKYIENLFNLSDLVCIYAVDKNPPRTCSHGLVRMFSTHIEENFPNFYLEDKNIFDEQAILGFWLYKNKNA